MSDDNSASDQMDVKRHYLKIRDGVDVDSTLWTYCKRTHFGSYTAADGARMKKLTEYSIEDPSIIEIGFRR